MSKHKARTDNMDRRSSQLHAMRRSLVLFVVDSTKPTDEEVRKLLNTAIALIEDAQIILEVHDSPEPKAKGKQDSHKNRGAQAARRLAAEGKALSMHQAGRLDDDDVPTLAHREPTTYDQREDIYAIPHPPSGTDTDTYHPDLDDEHNADSDEDV